MIWWSSLCPYGVFLPAVQNFVLLWLLLWAAQSDWKIQKIPNKILLHMMIAKIGLTCVQCLFCGDDFSGILAKMTAGFLTGGGLLFLFRLLSGGGIGAGDVKLLAVIGSYTGSRGAVYIFACSMVLAACFVLLWMLRKREVRKEIPLAPFLLAGTTLYLLTG